MLFTLNNKKANLLLNAFPSFSLFRAISPAYSLSLTRTLSYIESISQKTSKITIKPLRLDLTSKDAASPLGTLKLNKHYGPASCSSSAQIKSLKLLLPNSKSPSTSTTSANEQKLFKNMYDRLSYNVNFSGERIPQRIVHLSRKPNTNDNAQELIESGQISSKDESKMNSPVATTWAETGFNKVEKEQRISKLSKKTKSHERYKNNSDVQELQKRLALVLDKSKEKQRVQKRESINPRRQEIQQISQELSDLRKITHDLTIRNLHIHDNHRDSVVCTSCLRRSELNSVSPGTSKRNSMYYMAPDYKPTVRLGNIDTSLSKSKASLLIGLSDFPQTHETSETALGSDSTPIRGGRVKTKHQVSNPFDKMVMYRDKKMPFSLALTAKTRQRLFEELKRRHLDQTNVSSPDTIVDLRNNLVPEERAKFLGKLDEAEKQKKYKEMRSKVANSGAIYQIFAMSKASQRKLKAKIEEQFPPNSRFLDGLSNQGV